MATFTVLTTGQYLKQQGVKFGVYGSPAAGKTPLMATLPKPLIVATEEGLGSVTKYNLPYIRVVPTIQACKDLIDWLNVPANIAAYESIALDSFSFLTSAVLSDIRKEFPAIKDGRQFYAKLQEVIKPLVEALLGLNKNVVFVFWQGEYSERNVFKYHYPSADGSALITYCMHFFDAVLHLGEHQVPWINPADGVQYVDGYGRPATYAAKFLQTKTQDGIFARDRHGVLEVFEEANLTNIINKLTSA